MNDLAVAPDHLTVRDFDNDFSFIWAAFACCHAVKRLFSGWK